MNQEEMERSLVGAGWEVYEPSSPQQLLAGKASGLSILAYQTLAAIEDPVFELVDHRLGTTYWVRVIPTPRVAAVLLEEHGDVTERPLAGNRSR